MHPVSRMQLNTKHLTKSLRYTTKWLSDVIIMRSCTALDTASVVILLYFSYKPFNLIGKSTIFAYNLTLHNNYKNCLIPLQYLRVLYCFTTGRSFCQHYAEHRQNGKGYYYTHGKIFVQLCNSFTENRKQNWTECKKRALSTI